MWPIEHDRFPLGSTGLGINEYGRTRHEGSSFKDIAQ